MLHALETTTALSAQLKKPTLSSHFSPQEQNTMAPPPIQANEGSGTNGI